MRMTVQVGNLKLWLQPEDLSPQLLVAVPHAAPPLALWWIVEGTSSLTVASCFLLCTVVWVVMFGGAFVTSNVDFFTVDGEFPAWAGLPGLLAVAFGGSSAIGGDVISPAGRLAFVFATRFTTLSSRW